jgi:hypothetical protein
MLRGQVLIIKKIVMGNSTVRKKTRKNTDLAESKDDKEHLKPDEATLDLPEVKDIPGQEHVRPIPAGEMADTTISSADEEGEGILDFEEDELITTEDTNVSSVEKELLQQSSESMSTKDDLQLRQAELDKTDEDGTPLNERTDLSGEDLDVPGTDEEDIEVDDEENNPTSLNDDKEDPINTLQ